MAPTVSTRPSERCSTPLRTERPRIGSAWEGSSFPGRLCPAGDGGGDDVDPRAAARRFVEQRGVPIHPVLLGTSELSSSGLDLALETPLADVLVFERKTTPMKAQLVMSGAAGRKVLVKLQYEDRTGVGANAPGVWKDIPITPEARSRQEFTTTKNVDRREVTLSFVAEQTGGVQDRQWRQCRLEGEIRQTNNRVETIVNVSKGGLKVAYFDIANPSRRSSASSTRPPGSSSISR